MREATWTGSPGKASTGPGGEAGGHGRGSIGPDSGEREEGTKFANEAKVRVGTGQVGWESRGDSGAR